MALSTTGYLGFRVRVTPISGYNNDVPVTRDVKVAEQVNADTVARSTVVAQLAWGANVAFMETWLVNLNQL